MMDVLRQAKKLGNSVNVLFPGGSHTGIISELFEDTVSLIIREHCDTNTHQITQQTKAIILIESITCVVVTVGK